MRASEVEASMASAVEGTAVLADNADGYALLKHFVHGLTALFTELGEVKEHHISTLGLLGLYEAMEFLLHYIVSIILVALDDLDQLINILSAAIVSTDQSISRQNVGLIVVSHALSLIHIWSARSRSQGAGKFRSHYCAQLLPSLWRGYFH